MPRDANGNYTLPSGNPVVTDTPIVASWANPTMSDIGNEITNSLDRSGRGGMLAPLTFVDGDVTEPGIAFTNEPTMGFFRPAAGQLTVGVAAADQARFNAANQLEVFRAAAWSRVPDVDTAEVIAGAWSFASIIITGGTIDGAAIGGITPSTGVFTTVANANGVIVGINEVIAATGAIAQGDTATGAPETLLIGANDAVLTVVAGKAAWVALPSSPYDPSNVAITGGTIDGVTIGGTTPGAGTFSTLTSAGAVLTGGTIDGVTIGGTTPAVGTFTIVNNAAGAIVSVTEVPTLLRSDVTAALTVGFTQAPTAFTVNGTATPDMAVNNRFTWSVTGAAILAAPVGAGDATIFITGTGGTIDITAYEHVIGSYDNTKNAIVTVWGLTGNNFISFGTPDA